MGIVGRLDEYGRPAWVALTVLTFFVWWPLGLATLAFAIGSKRMGCHGRSRFGRWYDRGVEKARDWAEGGPWSQDGRGAAAGAANGWASGPSSGNAAFDEYRAETLRRLEEEQREFRGFLERLRMAKDKSEFDQFMADRRRRADQPPPPPPAG